MSEIYFEPWVGPDYYDGGVFNYRILAVGDSHYCDNPCELRKQGKCGIVGNASISEMGDCINFTKGVVASYLGHNGNPLGRWTSTYTKFTRALSGGRDSQINVKAVWNSIAFYNFVQSNIQTGPGQSFISLFYKGQNLYADSLSAFDSVVDRLQPDFIIVWGNNVWLAIHASNHIKCLNPLESGASPSDLKPIRDNTSISRLFAPLNFFRRNKVQTYEKLPIAMKMTHPCSSKFKYDNVLPLFKNFLKPSISTE